MIYKHLFKLNQSQIYKLKQAIGKYRTKLEALEEEDSVTKFVSIYIYPVYTCIHKYKELL